MRILCGTILAAAFAAVLSANATDVSVASFCERAKKEKLGRDPFGGGDFGLETAQSCKITEKK